ncbi:MAG: hypothetical protein EAZ99_06995 [Alphaproteobacteria bacterium]|nr:MAG: hypothetical protein EAZ99_06995 [Alphaproteobacteria bacterium]
MRLVRLDANGIESLLEAWRLVGRQSGIPDEDLDDSNHQYALGIARENPQDDRYGIFGLCDEMGGYHVYCHVNLANLKRSFGKTLRCLWPVVSPYYDFGCASDEDLHFLLTNFVNGRQCLAQEKGAVNLKLHFGSASDRPFLQKVVEALLEQKLEALSYGAWLEIKNLPRSTPT